LIFPSYIFSLNASDNYLKDKVMLLSEQQVVGTTNTEEGIKNLVFNIYI